MGTEEFKMFDWLREGANVLVLTVGGGAVGGRQVKRATVVQIERGVVVTDDRCEFSTSTLQRIGGDVSVPLEILVDMADPEARTLLFLEESRELEAEAATLLAVDGPRDDQAVACLADVRRRLAEVLREFVAEVAPLFPGPPASV